jgi:hypothetical protein
MNIPAPSSALLAEMRKRSSEQVSKAPTEDVVQVASAAGE